MTVNEVWAVCRAVIEEFKKEQNLLNISVPVTIVGNIHGNYHDLYRALLSRNGRDLIEEVNNPSPRGFVQDR
ncbi:hypothetical protein CAEBREN_31782 [Caenorhabditis brenneri]|uniref:Serine/threonine specific protein phosphatases domain-containing protein n=1 Tax=Caenorhabditis brenneri TaxID=135651 RepID=G0P4D0_CAEBE|nr:hypothetical protein CAEBREN_31782 [Caenorhabditis brenneri]